MIEKNIIACLTVEKNWKKYGKEFSPEFFVVPSYRKLYELLYEYWGNVEGIERVEKEVLEEIIGHSFSDVKEQTTLFEAITRVYSVKIENIEVLVRQAMFKWRAGNLLVEAETDLAEGTLDPEYISREFKALAKATEKDAEKELSPSEDVQNILTLAIQNKVYSTGLSCLDETLGGGFWAGEVVIFLGKLFGGKSFVLSHLASHNLLQGVPIQGFTCENSRRDWIIRIYQGLLRKSRDTILYKAKDTIEEISSLKLPPWSIKDYRTSGIKIPRIKRDIEEFLEICGGKKPLIIVDQLVFGGVLPTDRRISEPRFQLSAATEELIQIAAEYDVCLVSATQVNRPGLSTRVITSKDVAECLDIPRKAHVVISINQDEEDYRMGAIRFWIDKARERTLEPKDQLCSVRARTKFQILEDF